MAVKPDELAGGVQTLGWCMQSLNVKCTPSVARSPTRCFFFPLGGLFLLLCLLLGLGILKSLSSTELDGLLDERCVCYAAVMHLQLLQSTLPAGGCLHQHHSPLQAHQKQEGS